MSEPFGPGEYTAALGLAFDTMTPGRVEAHLDVHPGHHQPYGIVHGGVYCTIVESVGSLAGALTAQESGDVVVGVSNTTDFLRSHREGRLDVVATPIHVGRLQHLWQVDITRASDDKLVARGQLRLQVLPPERVGMQGTDPRKDPS